MFYHNILEESGAENETDDDSDNETNSLASDKDGTDSEDETSKRQGFIYQIDVGEAELESFTEDVEKVFKSGRVHYCSELLFRYKWSLFDAFL